MRIGLEYGKVCREKASKVFVLVQQLGGHRLSKHPSPAAIFNWFRELVSWVVDNWERKKFPGGLQWLDCLVWDKPGSAGTVGRRGLLASSLGSRRLGDVVLVASLLTACRS